MAHATCPHCGTTEIIRCPHCHSDNVYLEDTQSGYNGLSGTIVEEQVFKCDHCGMPFFRRVIFGSVTYHD